MQYNWHKKGPAKRISRTSSPVHGRLHAPALEADERRNLIEEGTTRLSLLSTTARSRLIRATGIGLIVGIGMAIFLPFLDQPPMLISIGAGIAAFVMMLFVE